MVKSNNPTLILPKYIFFLQNKRKMLVAAACAFISLKCWWRLMKAHFRLMKAQAASYLQFAFILKKKNISEVWEFGYYFSPSPLLISICLPLKQCSNISEMVRIWLKIEFDSFKNPTKLKTKANAWPLPMYDLQDVVLWNFYSDNMLDTWREGLCTRVNAGCPQGKFVWNFKEVTIYGTIEYLFWLHLWHKNRDQDRNIAPLMAPRIPGLVWYLL